MIFHITVINQNRSGPHRRMVHAALQTSAASILSERGLPMILDMLRVRDFDVQYACTRALLHLIRHNGEVGWNACFGCHMVAV